VNTYFVSAILFLLPWSLLFFSWQAFHRTELATQLPHWRYFLFWAALLVAIASTILNMAWNYSWLKSGGSPHGMGAAPGLWQRLGPFLVWSFVAATMLGWFGKQKARALMIAWSVSMYLVFQFIYVLQFD
jgi:hypothetical protein